MKVVGIRSLAPQPSTTKSNPAHRKYPYLLRDLVIDHPNQVWAVDITYIPYKKGFMHLVIDHGLEFSQGSLLANFQHYDG